MNITIRDAIVSALCYANIFDYPLTREEVITWLPYIRRYSSRSLNTIYGSLCPSRRLFEIRKKRGEWSAGKWTRAQRVARLLQYIPTILLVGVTGGLTRSNAKIQDDIDVFIITSPKTLWVTRAIATLTLDCFRLRRRPADTNVQNLVCLNMFMTEDGLSVAKKERDLFTAHEVLLMTPIFDRNGAYKRFFIANRWVKTFLPNAWEEKCRMKRKKSRKNSFGIWHLAFSIFEPLARVVQLWYMRKRRSTEIVTDTVIRFHPRDARSWIKRKLGERLTRFNVPLDKIFYGR